MKKKTDIRKSADDYAKEYKELLNSTRALESRISERLLFLCEQNPEIPVVITCPTAKTYYKAKSLGNKFYIETLPVKTRIDFIRIIETALAERIGKQTQFEFQS